LKKASKITTKLIKIFNSAIQEFRFAITEVVFLRLENALVNNGLRIGERCGTAKSVCSAKIIFFRENQA
jgi:hypothetical protein